ncbi:MAG TPA: hypothetical protein VGG99_17680 [Acetobacteraceae bacterium]|jgi:hypothetical protein
MRQMASGFALGSLSITLLFIPFLMVAVNASPDYTTAVETVIERSGILQPLVEVVAQANALRDDLMRPYTARLTHSFFPRIPHPLYQHTQ